MASVYILVHVQSILLIKWYENLTKYLMKTFLKVEGDTFFILFWVSKAKGESNYS